MNTRCLAQSAFADLCISLPLEEAPFVSEIEWEIVSVDPGKHAGSQHINVFRKPVTGRYLANYEIDQSRKGTVL